MRLTNDRWIDDDTTMTDGLSMDDPPVTCSGLDLQGVTVADVVATGNLIRRLG